MPTYIYRAVDTSGNVIQGSQDAINEHALETQLRRSGNELLRCVDQSTRRFRRTGKIGRKDLIGFCFHMEQMTRAGLPILEALVDLRDSVTQPYFREIVANILTSVESGKTLSQAMSAYPGTFDEVFTSLVAVGEETGELPDVLLKLTESLKWQDELIAKARSVVTYPAFVGIVVMAVVLFMMVYVVPQMVDFIKEMGNELPIHTRALIGLSNFVVGNWWWAVPLPFVLAFAGKLYADHDKRFRLFVDGWKLNAWYIGPIISKIILSRFASYFALCYSSGLDVLQSLKISRNIAGNSVIQEGIRKIESSIVDGNTLSAAVESTGLFPALVVRMIKMGESSGRLDHALKSIGYFYDREVSESIDRLQSMIEPAMTVVLGGIMAWIMLSVLGPIYDTISNIGI